jgi:ABC-2 type transport system ATP-binding protein
MREVLRSEGVEKSFGATRALSNVSLVIQGPQIVGVLGPNGAGKTTLLEILEGLSSPTSGIVSLFGEPLSRSHYPRSRVGVVLQRECAPDGFTTREYVDLFAAIHGRPTVSLDVLRAAHLEHRERTPVDRLSGGEAQRLFIATAMLHHPDLLFLDEPTAHLDPVSKIEIGERLREIGRTSTVIFCTHDLREADSFCDHLIFLVDGSIKAQGSRQDLIDAVPEDQRTGAGIEDAFFHFCQLRIARGGGRG